MAWRSNLVKAPRILAQSGVPIVILPAGAWSSTSGDMNVGTPMQYIPAGVVLVYVFASGIASAGLYPAIFGGTLANPTVKLTNSPATTIGAYTPTVGVKAPVVNITVPGGAIGSNGSMRYSALSSCNNTSGYKYVEFTFAGFGVSGSTANAANAGAMMIDRILRADGSSAIIKWGGSSAGLSSSGTGSFQRTAINIAVDQLLTIGVTIGVATDYVILEGYTVEIIPN